MKILGTEIDISKTLRIRFLVNNIYSIIDKRKKRSYLKNRTKYFCIGCNKTGTTSLAKAFREFDFIVGNQSEAELLSNDHFSEKTDSIINYCMYAEVFQDVPFSLPLAYEYLDKAYPNSKFILTIRDNPDQWYNSLVNFHSKIYCSGDSMPTWSMIKRSNYVRKNWSFEIHKKMFSLSEQDNPYDYGKLTNLYTRHIYSVKKYFKNRPEDLLIINLKDKTSFDQFKKFIRVKSEINQFPWENKTLQEP